MTQVLRNSLVLTAQRIQVSVRLYKYGNTQGCLATCMAIYPIG